MPHNWRAFYIPIEVDMFDNRRYTGPFLKTVSTLGLLALSFVFVSCLQKEEEGGRHKAAPSSAPICRPPAPPAWSWSSLPGPSPAMSGPPRPAELRLVNFPKGSLRFSSLET